MRNIELPTRTLHLPESWEELNIKQLIFALQLLQQLSSGIISTDEARFKLLFFITGYRPSRSVKDKMDIEIISLNLQNLADLMNFIFRKEDDKLMPNDVFMNNPFPTITIGSKRYHGKIFDRGYIPKTDITALEFSDMLDIYTSMVKNSGNEKFTDECINTICAILYPSNKDHRENIKGKQPRRMKKLHPTIKFGIILWFSGIIRYFSTHPSYSILFGSGSDTDNKITVGMYESVLSISEAGYGDITTIENQNLLSFFDAQVKNLKSIVSRAVAQGVDKVKLSIELKLPLTIIEKLC